MSVVHNFILFAPAGSESPSVPWADELTPSNPNGARWCRLDIDCFGDGKAMEVRVWGLVVNGRDPQDVIDSFRQWCSRELRAGDPEAVLLLRRDGEECTEVYSSRGSPRLLAAVRGLPS